MIITIMARETSAGQVTVDRGSPPTWGGDIRRVDVSLSFAPFRTKGLDYWGPFSLLNNRASCWALHIYPRRIENATPVNQGGCGRCELDRPGTASPSAPSPHPSIAAKYREFRRKGSSLGNVY